MAKMLVSAETHKYHRVHRVHSTLDTICFRWKSSQHSICIHITHWHNSKSIIHNIFSTIWVNKIAFVAPVANFAKNSKRFRFDEIENCLILRVFVCSSSQLKIDFKIIYGFRNFANCIYEEHYLLIERINWHKQYNLVTMWQTHSQ